MLTERLAGLAEAGVLIRRRLLPPAAVQVYELTQWGYRAEPLIQELGRWAAMSDRHDPTLPLSPASLMLSFRTMFDGSRAKGLAETAVLFRHVDALAAELRDTVHLHYYQELTLQETADALGIATIKAGDIDGKVGNNLLLRDLTGIPSPRASNRRFNLASGTG